MVDTFGTEKIAVEDIETLIRENFNMKPAAIISHLNLLRPIYRPTAAYGHFRQERRGLYLGVHGQGRILKKAAGI